MTGAKSEAEQVLILPFLEMAAPSSLFPHLAEKRNVGFVSTRKDLPRREGQEWQSFPSTPPGLPTEDVS